MRNPFNGLDELSASLAMLVIGVVVFVVLSISFCDSETEPPATSPRPEPVRFIYEIEPRLTPTPIPTPTPVPTPEPCPSGWQTIVVGFCYREEVLLGPVRTFLARVDLQYSDLQLRVAPAGEHLSHLNTVSESARARGTLVSVNGDLWKWDPKGGYFTIGPIVSDGCLIHTEGHPGYAQDVPGAVFTLDSNLNSWVGLEKDMADVDFAVGGSYALIRDGRLVGVGPYLNDRHPRTAIGIDNEKLVYLVVVDGRAEASVGMTLVELQQYLSQLGLVDAVNLDGGGSSTMVLQGSVVNAPSDGAERPVAAVVEVTEQR